MKLPRDLSGDDLAAALRKLGYQITRQAGSHMRLTTQQNGQHHVTVPAPCVSAPWVASWPMSQSTTKLPATNFCNASSAEIAVRVQIVKDFKTGYSK